VVERRTSAGELAHKVLVAVSHDVRGLQSIL
jgi:hypothetical protein